MELMRRGYRTVERRQIESVLKEHKFQHSGMTRDEGAAAAGRMLNVSAVVVVDVPRFGNTLEITAKMIDVETAEQLWIATGTGRTDKWLWTLGGALAGAGAGYALGGDSTGRRVGVVLGGLVGGVAGHRFSPSEKRMMQDFTKKIMTTLPMRGMVASPPAASP